MSILAGAAALAFLLALAVTPAVRRLAGVLGATDLPDARRVHTRPTARAGGLAVALAAIAAVAVTGILPPPIGPSVVAGAALLLAVGLLDDIVSLRAGTKLLAQITAAILAVAGGLRFRVFEWLLPGAVPGVDPVACDVALSVLWIVFVTNAINLSDGLDGLAAGIGVIGLAWLAAIALRFGDLHAALLPLVLAGALLGFLVYNFNPASIFLGDTGSLLIGYALAVLPLAGRQRDVVGPLGAFLLVGLPATDTLLAMARRFLSRCLRAWGDGLLWRGILEGLRNTVQPDRRHIHHRLLDLGFPQRRAVLLLYAAAAVMGGLAFAAADNPIWPFDILVVGLAVWVAALVQALGIDELQLARTGIVLPVLHRLARHRWVIVATDLLLVCAAHAGALALAGHPALSPLTTGASLVVVVTLQLALFRALGVYRVVWWVSGTREFALLLRACAAGSVLGYVALRLLGVPATATAALTRFLFLLPIVTAARFSPMLLASAVRNPGRPQRALICGTAREAQHALTHLSRNGMRAVEAIGFVELRPHMQGRQLARLPVLGTLDGLRGIVERQRVDHLVIADPELRGEPLRWARAVCRQSGVDVHRYVERLLHDSSPHGNGRNGTGPGEGSGDATHPAPATTVTAAGAAAAAGTSVRGDE